jgi:hypothetical protein
MGRRYKGVMMFLLNDVVLKLESQDLAPPLDQSQFANLRADTVSALGAELYAMDPLLHLNNPERAKRLAALIILKTPEINAALFLAPSRNCSPSQVSCRYAQLGFEVMSSLFSRQQDGGLTTVAADREVWRRLAA